jgi:peptidoglycan/xylan/chitin deacetylase (PgdA/CDA1 family)
LPGGRGLVLLYHSIAEFRTDPWSLAVPPARLAEHLEVLRKHCHPVSLTALQTSLQEGSIPDRAVAVTFDDGYANNLHAAKPLLERFDTPATVFVVSGALGGREFWWDELDRIITLPSSLPTAVPPPIPGAGATMPTQEMSDRQTLYRSLWTRLRPLPPAEQQAALAALQQWAGVPAGARPTHRSLHASELKPLAAGGLIEVGAHTVSHPCLASQSLVDQRAEIAGSKGALELALDARVTAFAYPFGSADDFTLETTQLVREAGFTSAWTTRPGVVVAESDPYSLPRANVKSCDGDEFARRLRLWFGAA